MILKNETRKTSFPTGIGLGTMMMGWRLDSKESEKIISLAYDNQILMIDTSVSYSRGNCHEIIGKALFNLKLRNNFFIATKVGGVSNDSDPPQNRGYSKHNIIRQCELSLTQLKIECIDLLQLHNPTNDFELHEILEALNLLITQGKIKNYGICNYSIENTKGLLSHISGNIFPEPLTSQFEYNLINFREQSSLFKFLESTNLKTLTWGPLASGLLTDWYLDKTYLKPNSRIELGRENNIKNITLNKISTKNILNKISTYCLKLNISAQVFSLLWILKTKPNNSPLIGPSSINQFIQLIKEVNNEKYKNIDFSSLSI
jgi:aryl-alcohol dehydrogenase-like predicted oxidoreductase